MTASAQTNALHNLDLQIERYNPQISLYNVSGAYAGYDPTFSFSGTHTYNDSPASFQNGLRVPGNEINSDSFSSSFNGATPWGMTYDLGGNASSSKGYQYATLGTNSVIAEKFLD